MASEAQKRATAKWQAANTKAVTIRFTPSTMDAYEKLMQQPNKTAFLVDLIRKAD